MLRAASLFLLMCGRFWRAGTSSSTDPGSCRSIPLGLLGGTAAGPAEVVEIGDRAEAIAYAVSRARPGDAVVVAGKGHESTQEVHGVKRPFLDADVLAALLDGVTGCSE